MLPLAEASLTYKSLRESPIVYVFVYVSQSIFLYYRVLDRKIRSDSRGQSGIFKTWVSSR